MTALVGSRGVDEHLEVETTRADHAHLPTARSSSASPLTPMNPAASVTNMLEVSRIPAQSV
ncbi:hypothetical protein [Enhygromyxa salina]|uniref:hypothetical protein n=1 Tax=Enhygromyxa salina TaxID=215803 RepID=UPI0011BA592D|nr:hypothetical protein [Enhygromyxa salina]